MGGTVDFPNQDSIFHNVFSVSGHEPLRPRPLQEAEERRQDVRAPRLVRVYCNIHPQMSALRAGARQPLLGARSPPTAAFGSPDVPAGTWVLKAWHERSGEARAAGRGARRRAWSRRSLTLDASKFKRAPHKNKFGKDYPVGERY